MKEELSMFSKTLDPDHLKSCIEIREDLLEGNNSVEDLQINTKELYEKGFKFPHVVEYDHVQSQLAELQSAQENLNQNSDNPILVKKFINIAQKVKKNFQTAYKDTWVDPETEENNNKTIQNQAVELDEIEV